MRIQEIKKLQEKVLKWLLSDNRKGTYVYEIDHDDILICDGFRIDRIPLSKWYIDIRELQTANMVDGIFPNRKDQQLVIPTEELREVKGGQVRVFKLEDGKTVWVNEKFIKEAGGIDYLRSYEITGKDKVSPICFRDCDGIIQHLMLPIRQK